ncbi:hypothetical protein [Streptomyces prunicolor]|uniref:hypothetical protein n=1 Tax=Streptomyces prunicolor TaxID=67348 RepID=UPI001319C5B3|nr:hypothetical protein [Streptomyces prunicolor]
MHPLLRQALPARRPGVPPYAALAAEAALDRVHRILRQLLSLARKGEDSVEAAGGTGHQSGPRWPFMLRRSAADVGGVVEPVLGEDRVLLTLTRRLPLTDREATGIRVDGVCEVRRAC